MTKKTQQIVKFIIIIIVPVILYACANVVAPTGGPRDEDPPVVVRSTPPNFSTYYTGQDVRIFFNEFVELKNLRQNMLVSPPLATDPEVRLRGRSIIMSISDTLRPNTTYNFFFGDAIVDITEGNPVTNFQFVVSTGSFVDSLSVRGKLVNAFTNEPEEGVFVMMYDNASVGDSVPMLRRPVYVSKTNKAGDFMINNMREGEYLMFALKDLNSTYMYDNPDELIAFYPELVSPVYFQPITPSVQQAEEILERLAPEADSDEEDSPLQNHRIVDEDTQELADSLLKAHQPDLPSYRLRLFKERDTLQRVTSASLVAEGKVNIIFRIPADSVVIREYINEPTTNWYLPEFSRNRDTLSLWIQQPPADTLYLEISDRGTIIDSVRVSMVRRAERARPGRTAQAQNVLAVTTPSVAARVHPFFRTFELHSATPLSFVDQDGLKLFRNDSIPVNVSFSFTDSIQRVLRMDYMPEPDSSYVLRVREGSMRDIFETENDSIRVPFKVNNATSYGTIILSLTLPPSDADENRQYVLQLMSENLQNVISERIVTRSGNFRFDYLPASTFTFRLIEDENFNGKWDTGLYVKRRQPEMVHIFPDKVQARLNWEIEADWDASKSK
jgi:hypothetical protein